jgi:hypothetical protein
MRQLSACAEKSKEVSTQVESRLEPDSADFNRARVVKSSICNSKKNSNFQV